MEILSLNEDNFKCLGSYIANTQNDINTIIANAWAALNSMNILEIKAIRKTQKKLFTSCSGISTSVWCDDLDPNSNVGKRLDGIYTRMLKKSWKDHISNKVPPGAFVQVSYQLSTNILYL